MKRIEEMHAKSAHKTAMDSIQNGGAVGSEDFNKAHASVTVDIACRFIEWKEDNEVWREEDETEIQYGYNSHKLGLYNFTALALFEEFCKTI